MPSYWRFSQPQHREADEWPVYCPDCGQPCEIRHLQTGLDYDWCLSCNQEVGVDDNLLATGWKDDVELDDESWLSIYLAPE